MCGDLWFSLVWSDVSSEIHHEHVNIHTIDSKPHLCDWYQDALNQVTITWNQFSTANLLYYVNSKTWTAVSVFSVHSSCKQNRNRWVKLCLKLWIKLPQQNHSKVVLSCGPKKKTIPQKSSKRSSQQSKKKSKKSQSPKVGGKKNNKNRRIFVVVSVTTPQCNLFPIPHDINDIDIGEVIWIRRQIRRRTSDGINGSATQFLRSQLVVRIGGT